MSVLRRPLFEILILYDFFSGFSAWKIVALEASSKGYDLQFLGTDLPWDEVFSNKVVLVDMCPHH